MIRVEVESFLFPMKFLLVAHTKNRKSKSSLIIAFTIVYSSILMSYSRIMMKESFRSFISKAKLSIFDITVTDSVLKLCLSRNSSSLFVMPKFST